MNYVAQNINPNSPHSRIVAKDSKMKKDGLKIELFHHSRTRSERVLWAIHELGMEEDATVKVPDLFAGEHMTPEMLKLNPFHQVPSAILTDANGDTLGITESCAIGMFLAEVKGKLEPPKANLFARAKYHRMNMVCPSNIDPLVSTVTWNEIYAPEEMRDPKAVEEARKNFTNKVVGFLNDMLGDSDYICGPHHDEFTMADISIAWLLYIANQRKMIEGETKLLEYMKRCMDRPAWAKSVA